MMSLLQQIIDEAVARDSDVTRLLRLSMVLAAGLNHAPLSAWVKHELEGYPDDASLPVYRTLYTQSKGNFIGRLQGQMQIPVAVLPEELRESYSRVDYRPSIAECARMTAGSDGKGSVRVEWPVLLAVQYGAMLTPGSQCTGAWMEFSVASLGSLVDQVKTKILAFALEIRAADPHAGVVPAHGVGTQLKEDKVSQIFNTTINGGTVQGLAFGNKSTEQHILNGVQPGDLGSLISAIQQLGISKAVAADLAGAVEADRASGEGGVGARAKAWLDRLKDVAVDAVASKGLDQLIGYATTAILAYQALPT